MTAPQSSTSRTMSSSVTPAPLFAGRPWPGGTASPQMARCRAQQRTGNRPAGTTRDHQPATSCACPVYNTPYVVFLGFPARRGARSGKVGEEGCQQLAVRLSCVLTDAREDSCREAQMARFLSAPLRRIAPSTLRTEDSGVAGRNRCPRKIFNVARIGSTAARRAPAGRVAAWRGADRKTWLDQAGGDEAQRAGEPRLPGSNPVKGVLKRLITVLATATTALPAARRRRSAAQP
jgi:hypothetical protein